jgi:hypothetical protein
LRIASFDTSAGVSFVQNAQLHWKRLRGFELLADVIEGIIFTNGIKQQENAGRSVA